MYDLIALPSALGHPRGRAITPSAIEETAQAIARAGAGVISLANGAPPSDELPAAAIAAALAAAMAGADALGYGPPRGEPDLLTAIERLHEMRGIPARPSVVVGGATQGLFLALYVLGSPGDTVLTDTATYCDTLTACANLQLHVAGVAGDAAGMAPEALDEALRSEIAEGRRPAAVYLIPTAHNPLGITLGLERRQALIAVARAHGVAIVEDDPYAHFDAAGAPSLAALAPDLVIRLDSVSKLLGPGLRAGWVSAPPQVLAAIEQLKAAVDVCVPVVVQRAVARLLPDLEALAARQMAGLAARRAALLGALDEQFMGAATWTRPRGGYFVWLRPGPGHSARLLAECALEAGVAVLPGHLFTPNGRDDAVRLSCARGAPDTLREAVARLRRAYEMSSQ